MMVSAAFGEGVDAKFVRASKASKVGRRSRGPSGAWFGSSERRASSGRIADVNGGEPEVKTKVGSTEIRMRARAWAAVRSDFVSRAESPLVVVEDWSNNLTPPCLASGPRWEGVLERDRRILKILAVAVGDAVLLIATNVETTPAVIRAVHRLVTTASSSRGSVVAAGLPPLA
jgi:hypothetical protein